ncbi:DISARM system helicase DrmA [Nannocystis sp. SCPEA4]|uniref:DISARM system helicase DrmA n=1 Tax=Nannocystis sp. SCPEA4 TaxID=2996787 RepID=UPI00227162C7|nr:DISARM system helicase DrmA [Nannocystis sp. SCPEA4]
MQAPVQVRDQLVSALALDLVGPAPDDAARAEELLPVAPSVWYLTGFLVPFEAPPSEREGDDADGELDGIDKARAGDDESAPEVAAARKGLFPSSIGLSMLVPADTRSLTVTARWGDYHPQLQTESESGGRRAPRWQRRPRAETLELPLKPGQTPHPIPNSGGLEFALSVRPAPTATGLPPGTRAVSVFLVNRRPTAEEAREQAWVFQAGLHVTSPAPLVPRPDVRSSEDWDDRVADLQYRAVVEHAVGHNVSVRVHCDPGGECRQVETVWLPQAHVEKVIATAIPSVDLGMEVLAAAPSGAVLADRLSGLVDAYTNWLAGQARTRLAEPGRQDTCDELIQRAEVARDRIAAGLAALTRDPDAFFAFQLANRAVATAMRQRACHGNGKRPDQVAPPSWRPFQLAFILLNLAGIVDPTHRDRGVVDLLFFPTGGGKTEAYLGLSAFTLVLRRLRNPGLLGAGVGVLMRYTLRLLTLDQLGRAATLICALELERQRDPSRLGPWPFEIGLWVGQAATPNTLGEKGDSRPTTARARVLAFQRNHKRNPSPIPLEVCPWCGEPFIPNSFRLLPDTDHPRELVIRCSARDCLFTRNQSLPLVAVDEPLYRRLPCFIIATVDKFAGLPYVGEAGALLGHADRADASGFYGPAEPGKGRPLERPLLPPDLIIQDELHLISGPLGTMVGLYETALDALATRKQGNVMVRPKIVASTATVRRAEKQIRALFGRTIVDVFPPPGPDPRDSFFARTVPPSERNARIYLGVASQGRSLKVVLLRTYLALMAAAQKQWQQAGGVNNPDNPADPYMTLLGYFNSLRELGGSRRIVEDEVNARLTYYGERKRDNEPEGSFASRRIDHLPQELTSRVSTSDIAESKRRLALRFHEKDRVDVVLATNMISVGLDITRLGLMVVLGQPKTAAEYIQATSRVGRDEDRPGLVITLLNVHRPRDRSHFERFAAWHASFYRAVEATSVTPFSPRALGRGLPAITVALGRHGHHKLSPARRAIDAAAERARLDFVADTIAARAESHDLDLGAAEQGALRQHVRARVQGLLDDWSSLAHAQRQVGEGLQYQREAGSDPPLLHQPGDPRLEKLPAGFNKFTAARSLRDVEPAVDLWIRNPDGFLVEGDAEEAQS